MKLIKRLLLVLIITFSLSTVGCSAWYQQFKNNPVQFVDDFYSKTDMIVEGLHATFDGTLKFLPPEEVVKAQDAWDKSILSLNNAKKVLRDAVEASVIAQESTPDWGKAIADVVDAVRAIESIVNLFASKNPQLRVPQQDRFIANYYAQYGAKK